MQRRVRPRSPRMRAETRYIAQVGQRAGVTEFATCLLGEVACDEIAAILPKSVDRRWLSEQLEYLASQHARWADQPVSPRSESRYWLELLSYLIWKSDQGHSGAEAELVSWRSNVDPDALSLIWSELVKLGWSPTLVERSPADWQRLEREAIALAADNAARALKGGDYHDFSLWLTIEQLIDLYERATDLVATYGAKEDGAESGRTSGRSRISASSCGRMIQTFFAFVDPGVTRTQSSNILGAILRRRRKQVQD